MSVVHAPHNYAPIQARCAACYQLRLLAPGCGAAAMDEAPPTDDLTLGEARATPQPTARR